MDAIGVDFQLSDKFNAEAELYLSESAPSSREQSPTPDDSNKSSTPDSISVSSLASSTVHRLASNDPIDSREQRKGSNTWSYDSESSSYRFASDLATGTTVPVSGASLDIPHQRRSTSSTTSSSSSSESRPTVSSLYISEYLTPSINYERQTTEQLLIALIGRAFDQPNKLATLLQERVKRIDDVPVAKFMPFTVKRKVLSKGSFSVRELKDHDLICLCYNASEARILLTGPDGYYSALLRLIERVMGVSAHVIVISICTIILFFFFPRFQQDCFLDF